MLKKLLILGTFAALIGGGYALWMFFKPHEDIRKKKSFATYAAEELIGKFLENNEGVDEMLFDQVIEVDGKISKLKTEEQLAVVTFDNGDDYIIQAYLPAEGNDLVSLKEDAPIALKCKYSGFIINDDNFFIPADIKLEKCFIQKK